MKPPLQIAVDASRVTLARRTGTEHYALALLRALLDTDSSGRYTLFFRDPPSPGLLPVGPHITPRVIPFPRLWTHIRFAAALWRLRPDVTFVPAHALPLWSPGPAVVTLHDVGYHYFPEAHPRWPRAYLHWSTRRAVARAAIILADSQATRHDLVAIYGAAADRIRVVYPGVDPALAPVLDQAALAAVRAKYGLPEQYLFFLGTLQPRKNIARLVAAYRVSGAAERGIALVLGGARGWLYDPAWTADIPGVIEAGYVADEDVAALYSGALALVFPSLYEGFGFPVLEAMRCGTPVIASSTSSLPELVGEAGLLVDPLDVDAIAAAISRVVDDAALRERLAAAGHVQAAPFTWERAARQTLEALTAAASH